MNNEIEDISEFHKNQSNFTNKIFNNDRDIIAVQGIGSFG